MADKGYMKFRNDIADALIRQGLPGAYMSVVLYVLRKTAGWDKPSDRISVSKMAKEIGISRRWCSAAVNDLEKMGILETDGNRTGAIRTMQVRSPENWDKPVKYSSHEKYSSHGNQSSHLPEKYSSHPCEVEFSGGEKYSSQEPEKYSSHTIDNIQTPIKDTIEKERENPLFDPDEDDDFDGYTGEELLKRWRAEHGTL